jgi:RNA polymerase sigma-70 factor, ECF subfamily
VSSIVSSNTPSSQGTVLKNLSTEELVERAQKDNDMRALEELVQRYQRSVYLTLQQLAPERNDIADLTQDVLLRMCRSIKSIRNPKTFKYWLNRIITNLFYDELRKTPRKLRTISMDEPLTEEGEGEGIGVSRDIPDVTQLPEQMALSSELDEKIREAIANLPEQFRTIIVLRELQGMSYEEIASLTNSNLGTVKSRLARARLKLQEAIAPYLKGK